jgi:mono/diheme cytochrome c family protein
MPPFSRNRTLLELCLQGPLGALALCLGLLAAAHADPTELPGAAHADPADLPGAKIFQKMCSACHGKNGEGVPDKYDEPLQGNRSVESLAKRIARTMPDDDVGACVGEDAKLVSKYIFEAFYSPAAQARIRPAEIDLARLTVEQYRNSVADLVGRFRPGFDQPLSKERGLKANYSGFLIETPEPPKPEETKPVPVPQAQAGPTSPTSPTGQTPQPQAQPPKPAGQTPKPQVKVEEKKKKDRRRVNFNRMDSHVAFSFGEGSPAPEKQMDVQDFSIRWDGSVIAEETGAYEFIIQSENSVRLYVNDTKNMLMDAEVTEGKMREEKKTIYLLGGRAYPIVLLVNKFREKTASITLKWKPPHGVVETIPQRDLSPQTLRQSMIVSTAFPPDDRSVGYERGTAVSKEWDAATTDAAIEVAEHVVANIVELSGVKPDAPDRIEKLKDFSRRFMETAFRRPLSEGYRKIVEKQFAAAKTTELALTRVVLFTLKSPSFLYPNFREDRPIDGYDVAARLALALWDSIPDKRLLDAAAAGKLKTREQIAANATRMVADARTKAKLGGFFHHWLDLERAESAQKDARTFPGFDAAALSDLRTSLKIFIDQVVWSDHSDYRELLQADYLLLNKSLGALYGKDIQGDDFQRVAFDPKERAGVITHPYLLAALANSKSTSPIHRGVFLTRNIVGIRLKPPPKAVVFEESKFDPSLTMREKITQLTKSATCQGCHSMINPLGFSLENYDAIGRWRTQDNHKPVDAVNDFSTDDGDIVHLTGARDIANYAANNPNGHRAFIHNLFHHTVKQAVGAYGPDEMEDLRQSFVKSGFNIQKLLAEIATVASAKGLQSANKVAQNPPVSATLVKSAP